ncbi:MAG: glycosyltransferase family 4 protein [Proteobacteria bacterium]|nr:glycosyltransferase family 4 protein [Pseudomonadota bacterium]
MTTDISRPARSASSLMDLMESVADPVKISIITSPSGWGGMEVHTVEMAGILESRGHDVSIVEIGSNLYKQKFPDKKKKIIAYAELPQLRNQGFFEIIAILRKLKSDICIFPKGRLQEGSWSLDLAARLVFSRYITIEHLASHPMPPKSSTRHLGGLMPGCGIWWYRRFLSGYLRSLGPHQVICVSNTVGNILMASYSFPEKKVKTIHNGINSNRFKPDHECKMTVRSKLDIPEKALVFGAIGRLDEVKGFELALELFKKLISGCRDKELWFILAGSGPERDKLGKMALDPDIKGKVKFIEFIDKPWELYPAFDFFLMPSRNEGLPLALLEAMACGCCPIAMGVGGIPEVITNMELGWLIKPDDKEGFFQAMNEAVELESDSLRRMAEKAREQIVLNFKASTQFSALADFIEKIYR